MKRNTGRLVRGFTLVELLVVIGIISLLISILLPALAKARAAAREVRCESNIRQFGIGLQMYCDANKGLLPGDSNNGSKSNPVDLMNIGTTYTGYRHQCDLRVRLGRAGDVVQRHPADA